jgi:hypothetical protein
MTDSTHPGFGAFYPSLRPQIGASGNGRGRGLLSAAAMLAIAASTACSAEDGGGSERGPSTVELGNTQEALGYTYNYEMPWPGGTIPYCYQPSPPISGHPQPGTTAYSDTISMVEASIAKYEAIPDAAIDFQGGGLCPDWDDYVLGGLPGTFRILITTEDAATRMCDPGTSIAQGEGFNDVCSKVVDYSKEVLVAFGKNYGEVGILHELAHALGFRHEYLRRSDGCDPNATTSINDGITAYDFYSIMNATYCHWLPVLSELDKVGLAFVYPGPTADRLTLPNSLHPSSTVFLTAETTAPIRFAQQVSGVESYHYSAAQWLKSTASGSLQIATGSSVSVGTLLGSSSEALLRGRFTDFVGRVRTTPYITVRRSPGEFASLVLAGTSWY